MEYVKLSSDERLGGKKMLLQTEVNLLTMSKRLKAYTMLREKELKLKIALKREINKMLEEVKVLDKVLPKSKVDESKKAGEKNVSKLRREDIDFEIENLRRRIATLGG